MPASRCFWRGFYLSTALIGSLVRTPAQTTNFQSAPAGTYPIDLPTTLRLAGAQNLDIQIARQRLKEAEANRTSALERFFPWVGSGISYHRRDGLAQGIPSGVISNANFQSYSPGGTLTAQIEIGDAIYTSLATNQLVRAAGHALRLKTRILF